MKTNGNVIEIKGFLKKKLRDKFPGVVFDILTPPNDKMGDYSTNIAFTLSKKEGKNGMKDGQTLAAELSRDEDMISVFERIEAVKPGFINFYLKKKFLREQLGEIYKKLDLFGGSDMGRDKTIIIEYSGTNIAKSMHVGHLRSTIIGDGLANIYKMLGYKVIRWNYIGDWGTQFGNLIAAFKLWGDEKDLKDKPISTMLDLYVRFHKEMKNDAELESRGREEFKKLEEGNAENRELWKMFRDYSMDEFDKVFRQLDIKFDITKGESGYEAVVNETIEFIEQKGILKKSEGADIIGLDNLPPALIRKSDGTSLYLTRDVASLKERIEKYNPEKILYIVANQQALHLEQLFAVAKMLGWTDTELIHIKFGMVLGENGRKLATREGKTIPLQEVIDKVVALALKITKEKNPELSDAEAFKIAQAVGIGALKYNDLKQHPYTDITFDWKTMLDISGNSGPYIQYTFARLNSILEKAEKPEIENTSLLIGSEEERLIKKLLKFPEIIENCAETNTLNGLALYIYELANDTNRFYESVRILGDDNDNRRGARLMLVTAVSSVLKSGLDLLGIRVLDRI